MPGHRPSLARRLTPTYAGTALFAILGASLFAVATLRQTYLDQTEAALADQAEALAGVASKVSLEAMPDLCLAIGLRTAARLTLIADDGRVRCDTSGAPADLDNHLDRPEVLAALRRGSGTDTRYSQSVLQSLMYVAVRSQGADGSVLIARAALPLDQITAAIARIRNRILLAAVVLLGLATVMGHLVSRRLSRPLYQLERAAVEIAAGRSAPTLPTPEVREFAILAEALNRMVAQLDAQLARMGAQRRELEGVLNGMSEAVIAVDDRQRMVRLNPAAGELFDLDETASIGRTIEEAIRHPALHDFVRRTLESDSIQEREIVLQRQDEESVLQAHGTRLPETDGPAPGALIVLHDVTRLRRLETVRRDFVANVSHELKTPITSIKGFTETLLTGALDDEEHARRFLEIIDRQADRLTAIIEDLLSLARIEREEESGALHVETVRIRPLLESATQSVLHKQGGDIPPIRIEADADLTWTCNPSLLEQALVNLVDNAVKYGAAPIEVRAERQRSQLELSVHDHGPGIPRDALGRLFERFYRLDPSRTRESGGTGLGLSIVKHIAQAHGGDVTVESAPGRGSTFRLRLPATPHPTG